MTLAIFDLDHTLIIDDSDHLWGEFLAEEGVVDGDHYRQQNDRFLHQYQEGTLDIHEFLRFSLQVLARVEPVELERLRTSFVERRIAPIVAPGAPNLLTRHREAGDHLMIITATNRFVTEPIAEMLGVGTLIATEPAMNGKRYTGEVEGTPSFREGKVARLEQWLDENDMGLAGATFYSDSRNDLPLLEMVDNPVAVDPDPVLREVAEQRNWPIISLRSKG